MVVADLKQSEKNQQQENGSTSRKSFTRTERDTIIAAFATNRFCPKASAFKHSYYTPFVQFLFFTGCRPEDATALIWGDIKGNQIQFNKAYSKGELQSTKTGEDRKFPINVDLLEILESHKASMPLERTKPGCLVFPGVDGKYITTGNFNRKQWQPIVKGLVELGEVREYLPAYNCRHTFITLCLEANVPVHTVAKWVGNSPKVIHNHYCSDFSQIQVPRI